MGDTEGGDHSLHGSLSGDLLYGFSFGFGGVSLGIRSIRFGRSAPEAQGTRGGDTTTAATGAARRDHRGWAQAIWWLRSPEAFAHGHQGTDLRCLAQQVLKKKKKNWIFGFLSSFNFWVFSYDGFSRGVLAFGILGMWKVLNFLKFWVCEICWNFQIFLLGQRVLWHLACEIYAFIFMMSLP